VCGFRPDGSQAFCLKHSSGASGCAFSALQPALLATTTESGSVFVWEMHQPHEEGQEVLCSLVCTLTGHK
jgi:WD40 repeat protein